MTFTHSHEHFTDLYLSSWYKSRYLKFKLILDEKKIFWNSHEIHLKFAWNFSHWIYLFTTFELSGEKQCARVYHGYVYLYGSVSFVLTGKQLDEKFELLEKERGHLADRKKSNNQTRWVCVQWVVGIEIVM